MQIEITIKEGDKIKKVSVRASMPFKMFGYTFAAHKAIDRPDLWNVTEVSTGYAVCCWKDKRKTAIWKAKDMMNQIGEAEVIKTIEHLKNGRLLINE